MRPEVPRQHRRCMAYPWCTGHSSPCDPEHHGKAHVVACQGGRELRFVLTAIDDGPPFVTVEVVLAEGGPPLEVVELCPVEVLQAAAALRELALDSQQAIRQ